MKPCLFASIERVEPAAFTIVMATGAFALCTKDFATIVPELLWAAWALNIANFIIFAGLLIFAACTWPFHKKEFQADMKLPQPTAIYDAIAISFLVAGAQCLKFDLNYQLAFTLWAIGCVLTLAISFAINFYFFVRQTPTLQLFTPVFFIPVGGLTVIPVAGIPLMAPLSGFLHDLLFMINCLALGSGLLLYLGLFCMLLQRHYLTEHLPHHLTPTIWIHLAPIGWGGVSFAGFAMYLGIFDPLAKMLTALLWGGCCWWLIMCAILTIRAMASRQMTFTLAYWAFIFPLGSITVLSFRLGQTFLPAFYCTWLLMAAIWVIAACKTLTKLIFYITHHGHNRH